MTLMINSLNQSRYVYMADSDAFWTADFFYLTQRYGWLIEKRVECFCIQLWNYSIHKEIKKTRNNTFNKGFGRPYKVEFVSELYSYVPDAFLTMA